MDNKKTLFHLTSNLLILDQVEVMESTLEVVLESIVLTTKCRQVVTEVLEAHSKECSLLDVRCWMDKITVEMEMELLVLVSVKYREEIIKDKAHLALLVYRKEIVLWLPLQFNMLLRVYLYLQEWLTVLLLAMDFPLIVRALTMKVLVLMALLMINLLKNINITLEGKLLLSQLMTTKKRTAIFSLWKYRLYSSVKIHLYWTLRLFFWRTMSLLKLLRKNVVWSSLTQLILIKASSESIMKTESQLSLIF